MILHRRLCVGILSRQPQDPNRGFLSGKNAVCVLVLRVLTEENQHGS
jgi:hypothetical protein